MDVTIGTTIINTCSKQPTKQVSLVGNTGPSFYSGTVTLEFTLSGFVGSADEQFRVRSNFNGFTLLKDWIGINNVTHTICTLNLDQFEKQVAQADVFIEFRRLNLGIQYQSSFQNYVFTHSLDNNQSSLLVLQDLSMMAEGTKQSGVQFNITQNPSMPVATLKVVPSVLYINLDNYPTGFFTAIFVLDSYSDPSVLFTPATIQMKSNLLNVAFTYTNLSAGASTGLWAAQSVDFQTFSEQTWMITYGIPGQPTTFSAMEVTKYLASAVMSAMANEDGMCKSPAFSFTSTSPQAFMGGYFLVKYSKNYPQLILTTNITVMNYKFWVIAGEQAPVEVDNCYLNVWIRKNNDKSSFNPVIKQMNMNPGTNGPMLFNGNASDNQLIPLSSALQIAQNYDFQFESSSTIDGYYVRDNRYATIIVQAQLQALIVSAGGTPGIPQNIVVDIPGNTWNSQNGNMLRVYLYCQCTNPVVPPPPSNTDFFMREENAVEEAVADLKGRFLVVTRNDADQMVKLEKIIEVIDAKEIAIRDIQSIPELLGIIGDPTLTETALLNMIHTTMKVADRGEQTPHFYNNVRNYLHIGRLHDLHYEKKLPKTPPPVIPPPPEKKAKKPIPAPPHTFKQQNQDITKKPSTLLVLPKTKKEGYMETFLNMALTGTTKKDKTELNSLGRLMTPQEGDGIKKQLFNELVNELAPDLFDDPLVQAAFTVTSGSALGGMLIAQATKIAASELAKQLGYKDTKTMLEEGRKDAIKALAGKIKEEVKSLAVDYKEMQRAKAVASFINSTPDEYFRFKDREMQINPFIFDSIDPFEAFVAIKNGDFKSATDYAGYIFLQSRATSKEQQQQIEDEYFDPSGQPQVIPPFEPPGIMGAFASKLNQMFFQGSSGNRFPQLQMEYLEDIGYRGAGFDEGGASEIIGEERDDSYIPQLQDNEQREGYHQTNPSTLFSPAQFEKMYVQLALRFSQKYHPQYFNLLTDPNVTTTYQGRLFATYAFRDLVDKSLVYLQNDSMKCRLFQKMLGGHFRMSRDLCQNTGNTHGQAYFTVLQAVTDPVTHADHTLQGHALDYISNRQLFDAKTSLDKSSLHKVENLDDLIENPVRLHDFVEKVTRQMGLDPHMKSTQMGSFYVNERPRSAYELPIPPRVIRENAAFFKSKRKPRGMLKEILDRPLKLSVLEQRTPDEIEGNALFNYKRRRLI